MKTAATRIVAAALLVATFALGSAAAAAACSCPVRTDDQCLGICATGVGSPYDLGHARWSTSNRSWGGADCSGFVIKGWQVPRSSSISEDYHPYYTGDIFNANYHWYSVTRANLHKSDAVGYSAADAGTSMGHVVMFRLGDPFGSAYCYESTPPRIRAAWRSLRDLSWKSRRRHQLTLTYGPA